MQQQMYPAVNSYYQQNVMAQQVRDSQNSQKNIHQPRNSQQYNARVGSSSMYAQAATVGVAPSGQGLYSTSYNMDSQPSSTFPTQNQYNTNQTQPSQSWQRSNQNLSMSQGSQHSQLFQTPLHDPTHISSPGIKQLQPRQLGNYESSQQTTSAPRVPGSNPAQVHQSQPSTTMFQQRKNDQRVTNLPRDQIPSQHQQAMGRPLNTHINQQHQSNQGYHQTQTTEVTNVVVETATEGTQKISTTNPSAPNVSKQEQEVGHQNLSLNEGSGIDARTQLESPSIQATRKAETVQGAPGSGEGRRSLLESALLCDLPTYLIDSVLENPNLSKVKDPASVKVHVVELLKLLTQDPGFGLKFQLVLEKNPSWKKYVSQDHSLFITGIEQKTDYFLTDGSSPLDSKKMLTEG